LWREGGGIFAIAEEGEGDGAHEIGGGARGQWNWCHKEATRVRRRGLQVEVGLDWLWDARNVRCPENSEEATGGWDAVKRATKATADRVEKSGKGGPGEEKNEWLAGR
jgi:hypothetical protein